MAAMGGKRTLDGTRNDFWALTLGCSKYAWGEQEKMQTDRTEYFSDAVLAIAITLLVLEIRVPHDGPLGPALVQLWPSYVAYAISFLVVGAIWLNHHLMFAKFAKADSTLMFFNLMMLMAVAFLPFPTAVLAEALHRGEDQNIAAAFYGCTLTAGGLFVNLTWHHAVRSGLLIPGLSEDDIRRVSRRYLVGPVIYAVAAVVGLFVPVVALVAYAFLNLFYLWPRRHRAPSPTAEGNSERRAGKGSS
jgi:uncharacterized membrane protein